MNYFSVIWSLAPNRFPVSCSISIRFNFLSTDFSRSKGAPGGLVRLYAKTEMLSSNPSNPLLGPTAEVCFCKIKLFRDHGAERKLSNDFYKTKKTIDKLGQQIALMEAKHQSGKVPEYEESLFDTPEGYNGLFAAQDNLYTKLAKLQYMSSTSRPTSVLDVKGDERDDPGHLPLLFPGESRLRQQPSSRTTCMICSRSDHQLEDCPYQKFGFSSSSANVGFWTVGGSRSRAASVHSQSSERNSSLHGSGGLDLEDQDLSFPDGRSRRSSASFSESSAAFPPPPVYIERERYPPANSGKEVTDQPPKPLRFFCDICEQEIEVLRRRDWQ